MSAHTTTDTQIHWRSLPPWADVVWGMTLPETERTSNFYARTGTRRLHLIWWYGHERVEAYQALALRVLRTRRLADAMAKVPS